MAAIEMPTAAMGELGSLLCESSFSSSTPTDTDAIFSNAASLSSTPPTTVSPDSMSLASEPDVPKPESVAASSIEAAVALPETENEQHESRQQTPVGQDAIVVAEQPPPADLPSTARPRRARSSLPVYNIARLAGTDAHGRRRSKGDTIQGKEKRRRTISDAMVLDDDNKSANDSINALAKVQGAKAGVDASDLNRSITSLKTLKSARISKKVESSRSPAYGTRRATRLSAAPVETIATKLSAIGKRGKKAVDKGLGRISRELMRLQDTNEFAHIETRPVRYSVWSNGKYVDVDAEPETAPQPPRKKVKVDTTAANGTDKVDTEKQAPAAPAVKRPRAKKWLEKGLYAGQEAPIDISKGLTAQEKKKLATLPELVPSGKPNRTLPQPMYNGLRVLIHGRDFKLPFDICNPLPPGQPKPAAYRTMTKNRFVGDASAYWKKTPHFEDFASRCVCKPEDGCGEDCQNRIMLYECDDTNCSLGKGFCMNRAFQDLQERTKKGGRYRVGVEVYKTGDRGYGVRSNRCFKPNQIIMEYTGEIITEEECERRMNEVYKDNECYYLMSFDQNMIIDATTGSIARFVNHSCSPNCRMIKWIVSGQPRMALFAGDRPITTGEELTYDYNFDPFSAKNVQKCLCGSPNCRGVLGPKPKEVKPPKPKEEKKSSKSSKSSAAKAAKRKLKDVFAFDADEEEEGKAAKKRKIKAATGLKRTLSSASLKAAKGAVKGAVKGAAKGAAKGAVATIKRSVSSISVAAKKKTVLTSSSKGTKKIKVTTKKAFRRASTTVVKKHGKKSTAAATPAQKPAAIPSRSPSLTIVAAGVSAKQTPPKETAAVSAVKTSSRKLTPSRRALEAGVHLERSPMSAKSRNSNGVELSRTMTTTTMTKIRLVTSSSKAE